MTPDDPCESCGKRGRELVAIGFDGGNDVFAVCVPCAADAVTNGHGVTLAEVTS